MTIADQLSQALRQARQYVLYGISDSTGSIRAIASRHLTLLDAALAAYDAAPDDDAKDAARLDWVFSHWPNGIHVECCAVGGPTVHGLRPVATIFYGSQKWEGPSLRAAIDAARSKP
jgi:hypothetical protein